MTGPRSADAAAPHFTPVAVATAVLVCLLSQTLASLTLSVPAVVAPIAARDFGVSAAAIGYFIAPVYVAGIAGGLIAAGLMRRFGALRLFQVGMLLLALALVVGTTSRGWALPLCALLIGLPYGVINPLSAHVLAARTPKNYMATIFAIKQTGVPLGSVLAGVLIPSLMLIASWQWAALAVGGLCVLMAIALQPLRAEYDAERNPDAPLRLASVAAPVALAWRNPALREMSIVSGTFSFIQVNLTTFLVSYFNLEVGLTLVAAGFLFSCAQLAGMFGRVFWGTVADRWVSPYLTLGGLGIAIAILQSIAAAFSASWPLPLVAFLAILLGGTAIAWNGVHFAEVTRRSPPAEIGSASAGVQFFTFGGALLGPLVFSPLVSVTGSYSISYALSAVLPFVVGVRLLLRRRR